jgi:hypothetical protein
MKKMKTSVVLGLVAAFFVLAAIPLAVTNFTQVHIDQLPQGGTATPRLLVDNKNGPSVIAEFRDNKTPVARIPNGGGFDLLVGTFTNSGDLSVAGNFTVTGTSDQTGAATFNGAVDIDGNLTSGTGSITATDSVLIDGLADAIQLTVQGWTTQTTNLTVFEQSDGTDVLTITNAGAIDALSTIQFGADDNYALGYATSTQEIACVSTTITGTAAVAVTGVTTPTFGWVTLVTDPGAGAGDPFIVTFDAPTTTSLVVNVWQDDATAGTSGAVVHVCAIGDE